MTQADAEENLNTWWATSRPYRVMAELVAFSLVALALLAYILSEASDDPEFRFLSIQPLYAVGIFAGAVGGAARGRLLFWRRRSYEFKKKDYWKHALPLYIGTVFGFLMTLVFQSTLKVVGVTSSIGDSGGLSFVAMVCMLCGLFADRAERKFLKTFDRSIESAGP